MPVTWGHSLFTPNVANSATVWDTSTRNHKLTTSRPRMHEIGLRVGEGLLVYFHEPQVLQDFHNAWRASRWQALPPIADSRVVERDSRTVTSIVTNVFDDARSNQVLIRASRRRSVSCLPTSRRALSGKAATDLKNTGRFQSVMATQCSAISPSVVPGLAKHRLARVVSSASRVANAYRLGRLALAPPRPGRAATEAASAAARTAAAARATKADSHACLPGSGPRRGTAGSGTPCERTTSDHADERELVRNDVRGCV